jgi:hypothetical protein
MSRDDFISIDAIRFGLNGLQNNFRFFLVLMIIVAVLYNLPTLITTYFFKLQIQDGTLSFQKLIILILQALISIIIYLTVDLGLLRIALKFRDNATVEFMDLFREHKLLLKYLVSSIIFYMMIVLPFFIISAASALPDRGTTEKIVFVIAFLISLAAAAYLFLKYQFYGYFIVDRGSGSLEALRLSGRITKGVLRNLFIFWLEIGLCISFALGMVSIFVGILISAIMEYALEGFVPGAGDIVSSAINLFIAVPIIKLATADIYRRLEWRAPAAVISDNSQTKAGDLPN